MSIFLLIQSLLFYSAVEESHSSSRSQSTTIDIESANITDEEKEKLKISYGESPSSTQPETSNRPFLDTVLSALDCSENDYLALLSLCLIYALANNEGKAATTFCVDFVVIDH